MFTIEKLETIFVIVFCVFFPVVPFSLTIFFNLDNFGVDHPCIHFYKNNISISLFQLIKRKFYNILDSIEL